MSEQADRDALFRAILNSLPICCEECREDPDGAVWQDATTATDAILASDWLAQRDRRVAVEAVEKIAREWQYGGWTALSAPIPAGSIPTLAQGQIVTDWLRERVTVLEEAVERG